MSAQGDYLISQEEEQAVHGRLVASDPTAPADLAQVFLDPLIAWLAGKNSKVPREFCIEAAEDALVALMKSPGSFDPSHGVRLAAYLRMSAQGDLKNILRSEGRHHRRRKSLKDVELSSDAGKYLAEDVDPSVSLVIREECAKASETIVSAARQGLSEEESQALDLMLEGERKTAPFAAMLGLTHLPAAEQRAEVNRLKNKLKKRLQRGKRHDV